MVGTFINNRLRKVENAIGGESFEILEKISKGVYYDELTDEQKLAYKRYKESLGSVAADVAEAELDILFLETPPEEAYHFQLSKREKPPTPEEHALRVQEVEKLLLEEENNYE